MPELPEVEVVRQGLATMLRGRRVVDWWFSDYRNVSVDARLERPGEPGWIVGDVTRTGKWLRIAVGPRAELHVHLGMSGRLGVHREDAAVRAHTHARFVLDDGRELRYVDPRRFGRCDLHARGRGLVRDLGLDALRIEAPTLAMRLRSHRIPIKAALLNQRLLAGLGNIYADEILHAAGVHPLMVSNRVKNAEVEAIVKAMRSILRSAIASGGSTIRDYVDAHGRSGGFQADHRVYGRTGRPCRACATPIRRVVVAGRSTHYCPQCQPKRRRVARPLDRKERTP